MTEILDQIEQFMVRWNYTPTEFSIRALGDPQFVAAFRSGIRSPSLRTVNKLTDFMAGPAIRHLEEVRALFPYNKPRLAADLYQPEAPRKARGRKPAVVEQAPVVPQETSLRKPHRKTGRPPGRPRKQAA